MVQQNLDRFITPSQPARFIMNPIAEREILTAKLWCERRRICEKLLLDRMVSREVFCMLRSDFFKALNKSFDRHEMAHKQFRQQFILHGR